MEKTDEIKRRIKNALKRQGTYSRDLELCIGMCAGSYAAFLAAQADIAGLEHTYVEETSREGNVRLVPHPAFRVLRDTQEMVRRSLRELGLTLSTLAQDDDDPMADLMARVQKEGGG